MVCLAASAPATMPIESYWKHLYLLKLPLTVSIYSWAWKKSYHNHLHPVYVFNESIVQRSGFQPGNTLFGLISSPLTALAMGYHGPWHKLYCQNCDISRCKRIWVASFQWRFHGGVLWTDWLLRELSGFQARRVEGMEVCDEILIFFCDNIRMLKDWWKEHDMDLCLVFSWTETLVSCISCTQSPTSRPTELHDLGLVTDIF